MTLSKFYIDDIIKTALLEDINYIDLASDCLIPEEQMGEAYFVAKDSGVLCGIEIAMRVFELLSDKITYKVHINDGQDVKKGDIIAEMKGDMVSLLKGERTALNILQHLSGISTATNLCVKAVEGTKARIVETRKTLPGLRPMQKYAVTMGGGKNHRYNLSDAAMIKDNHIDACGSLEEAVRILREKLSHMNRIEVEVRDLDELKRALKTSADVIMLDNMSPEMMKEAVKIADGKVILEASGNITLANIKEVAETGVDVISLGALTHSVKAFDISMKIK